MDYHVHIIFFTMHVSYTPCHMFQFKAMVSMLDEFIGNVEQKLKDTGLYNNTVLIFSSDNGGDRKFGGNKPLKGNIQVHCSKIMYSLNIMYHIKIAYINETFILSQDLKVLSLKEELAFQRLFTLLFYHLTTSVTNCFTSLTGIQRF